MPTVGEIATLVTSGRTPDVRVVRVLIHLYQKCVTRHRDTLLG
jgi:hypothetical protein